MPPTTNKQGIVSQRGKFQLAVFSNMCLQFAKWLMVFGVLVLWFYGFMVSWFYVFMFYGFMVLWLYAFMVLGFIVS